MTNSGLYENFLYCEKCRGTGKDRDITKGFFTTSQEFLDEHKERCDGKFHAWCNSCRFDCQDLDEVAKHRDLDECVNETSKLIHDLLTMEYDFVYDK